MFWNKLSSNANGEEEALFSFIEYLQLINSHANKLSFEIACAEDYPDLVDEAQGKVTGKKELLGVVWMTATMG